MAWTPEMRAKAMQTRQANAAKKATGMRLGDVDEREPIEAVHVHVPEPEKPIDDYRTQRIAELRARRESRGHDSNGRYTLHVPEQLKRGDLHYFWANDAPGAGNFQDLVENKFYDPVLCEELEQDGRNHGRGSRITRYVGTGPDGKPMNAILCCKPKEWYTEDQVRQNVAHEELMAQISRREPVLARDAGDRIDAANAEARSIYVPREGRLPPA